MQSLGTNPPSDCAMFGHFGRTAGACAMPPKLPWCQDLEKQVAIRCFQTSPWLWQENEFVDAVIFDTPNAANAANPSGEVRELPVMAPKVAKVDALLDVMVF